MAEDKPAEKAGVRQGWRLVSIAEKSCKRLDLEEIQVSFFREYLDEKLTLDISHKNNYEIGNFTLFEIISNNGLMDIAKEKGYLASRASATGDNVTASRDFKEKLDLLDASIKNIVEKLTQVRGLGCPKLRASELLGFCEEILEDYYYSKHINKMAKTNLLKYARFNELLAAVEDYPENPIPKGIIST